MARKKIWHSNNKPHHDAHEMTASEMHCREFYQTLGESFFHYLQSMAEIFRPLLPVSYGRVHCMRKRSILRRAGNKACISCAGEMDYELGLGLGVGIG